MIIKNRNYTVGELAKFYGVSLDTIRFYDKKGILSAQKAKNDYRSYSRADLIALDQILSLKRAGLSLNEVSNLVNDYSIEQALECCQNRIEALNGEIALLQAQKQELERYTSLLNTLYKDWNVITLEMSETFYMKDIMTSMAETKHWLEKRGITETRLIAYNKNAADLHAQYQPSTDEERSNLSNCYIAAKIEEKDLEFWEKEKEDGDWIWRRQLCVHAKFRVLPSERELFQDVQRIQTFVNKHNLELKGDAYCWIVFTERNQTERIDYYDCWYPVVF